MLVEIRGVQFVNKGAELMLEAIYSRLRDRYGEKLHIALSPRNSPYYLRSKYRAFQKVGNLKYRFDWSYISWLLPKSIKLDLGMVTHRDIDVVLDASGFAYGDQWTPAMFRSAVRLAEQVRSQGGKYIFMPQAMGPFKRKAYKKLLTRAVQAAELFYVRDKKSYDYVTSIVGIRENVILSPDFTNLVASEEECCKDERLCVVIPNSKMLRMQTSAISSSYIDVLKSAIKYVRNKGLRVEILNHEGAGDLDICNALYSAHLEDEEVTLVDGLDAIQVKKKIAEAKFCISSRFHGCVSSLSQNVPVIATSWSHKYEMLFADYGVENLVYRFDGKIEDVIDDVMENFQSYKMLISEKSVVEKKKANDMWSRIYSALSELQ